MNKQEIKKIENQIFCILNGYLKKNDIVILALSGGSDSIFLLNMLHLFSLSKKIKVIAVHINHMLRGDESDKDEKFAENSAKNLNLGFIAKKINIKDIARKEKKGLEECGRIERYKFFKQTLKKNKAKYIFLGHHSDDNLETIILNFTRGAGLDGLAGMQMQEQNLLRPLLYFSKAKIKDYLKTRKIKFIEDKSNKDTKFTRNFIRIKIVPLLKKINPNIAETISANLKNLADTNNFLQEKADLWIQNNRINTNTLDIKILKKEPEIFQKIILRRLIGHIKGNTGNIENTHIDETIELIKKNFGNKLKKFKGIKVYLKNNQLSITLL